MKGRIVKDSTVELDRVDRALLRELVRDGRATHAALGEAIGRSPTAVARRQGMLEEDGVIQGYVANVDMHKLGFGTTIHMRVTLESQRKEVLEAFEAAIQASPSVVGCDLISGSADYVVLVSARSLDHFAEVHREELSRLPGVARMESGFVLRQVVSPRLPGGVLG